MSIQVMASSASVVLTRPATSTVLRAGVHPDGTIHYIEIEATESDGDRVEVSFQTHDLRTLRSIVAAMQRGLAQLEDAASPAVEDAEMRQPVGVGLLDERD